MRIKRFEKDSCTTTLNEFAARDFGKFNRPWHRDFCYSPVLCDALILSVMSNACIGMFAITPTMMVDGAQRITTLRLFIDNQFSVNINNKLYFYKDLPNKVKWRFDNYKIHYSELDSSDEDELIQYHYMVNMHCHRSKTHRRNLGALIKEIYTRKGKEYGK